MGHTRMNLCRTICSGFALLFLMILPGITALAMAEGGQAIIAFGKVAGYSDEEICVPVTITDNPGLASFRFRIEYDAEQLTPVAVERGTLLTDGALYSDEEGNDTGSLTFLWYHTQDVQGDGELAVIRFRVASTANGDYPLTVHYSPDDISNAALETVPHTVQDGSIHVDQKPTHITINPPDKLWYWAGEDLDLTGMTVTAHYANGTSKAVSNYSVTGFDNTQVGKQTLTVTYGDFIDTFEIEILAYLPGDTDGDNEVTSDDATYLLNYTFFPGLYPINQDCDFDGDGAVDSDDAVYLLNHTFFPNLYPLK